VVQSSSIRAQPDASFPVLEYGMYFSAIDILRVLVVIRIMAKATCLRMVQLQPSTVGAYPDIAFAVLMKRIGIVVAEARGVGCIMTEVFIDPFFGIEYRDPIAPGAQPDMACSILQGA